MFTLFGVHFNACVLFHVIR